MQYLLLIYRDEAKALSASKSEVDAAVARAITTTAA